MGNFLMAIRGKRSAAELRKREPELVDQVEKAAAASSAADAQLAALDLDIALGDARMDRSRIEALAGHARRDLLRAQSALDELRRQIAATEESERVAAWQRSRAAFQEDCVGLLAELDKMASIIAEKLAPAIVRAETIRSRLRSRFVTMTGRDMLDQALDRNSGASRLAEFCATLVEPPYLGAELRWGVKPDKGLVQLEDAVLQRYLASLPAEPPQDDRRKTAA